MATNRIRRLITPPLSPSFPSRTLSVSSGPVCLFLALGELSWQKYSPERAPCAERGAERRRSWGVRGDVFGKEGTLSGTEYSDARPKLSAALCAVLLLLAAPFQRSALLLSALPRRRGWPR